MIKLCPKCGIQFSHARNKYCSINCSKQLSDERKQKVSNGRKKYLLENKELHPWKRSDKFKSEPCEKVKQFLRDCNIQFVEEWNPLEDRNFSIDIAFPDIKLGIEINGNQHYTRDGKLSSYYQERHDLIESAGWTLLELHYSIAFDIEKFKAIIEIREQPDYSEYFRIKEEKRNKRNQPKTGSRIETLIKNTDLKWEPYKEKILNSNIDFSKFGWVNKASVILGTSAQNTNRWMKRYLPDFYENKCFKRKSPRS